MREASEAASSSGISKWSSVKDGTLAVVDAEGVVCALKPTLITLSNWKH